MYSLQDTDIPDLAEYIDLRIPHFANKKILADIIEEFLKLKKRGALLANTSRRITVGVADPVVSGTGPSGDKGST